MKPTKEVLENLYLNEKVSPDVIAKMYGVNPRTMRGYMMGYGIKLLGPQHLRKGKSAEWNVGLVRSPETKEKNAVAHRGKTPYNFGDGRVNFICSVCQKEVWDKPYRKRRTCSKECRDKMMSTLRGENGLAYNENNRSIQKKRLWKEYYDWRKAVYERDKFTCQCCGQVSGNLTAHHKNSYATHPDGRIDINNGVTLCYSCHSTFHRKYGTRNTTEYMFKEFLTMYLAEREPKS